MSHIESAEASVIGACMLVKSAYWQVADLLSAEDFSDQRHRALWVAIGERVKEGADVDAVTIMDAVPKLGAYALQIANGTPGASNIRGYAELVVKHATHRRVQGAGRQIAALGPADALGEAQRLLADVARPELAAIRPARDVLVEFVADLQAKCDSEATITGLPSGFAGLDEMTSGLQPGDLIIVAGRPSMGKSTFAQNVAERVALPRDDGNDNPPPTRRVLFFTQEMSAASVLARSVSSIGHVPFGAIRSPKGIEDHHWPKINGAASQLKKSGLLFDESCGITAEQVSARARQCHSAAPLSLIVIDYLQYMRMPRADSAALAIQDITRELKALAKALGVPVMLLSQLNRKLEERHDKRPMMADLRESGAIEQDADIVLFLYRDGVYNKTSPHKDYAELIVAKQRNGCTGMVPMVSRLDQMRFEDCPDGLPEIVVETAERSDRGFNSSRFPRDRKAAAAGR